MGNRILHNRFDSKYGSTCTLLFILCLLSTSAFSNAHLSTRLQVEFDSNVWDLSDSEQTLFREKERIDPDIVSVEDWLLSADATWRSKIGRRNQLDFNLSGVLYRHNKELDYWSGDISWRQQLGPGRNFWLAFTHTPNQFLGSYTDEGKVFHEKITKNSINLKYSWWRDRNNALLVEYRYGRDDYSSRSPDLDADIHRTRLSWLHRISNHSQVKSSILYQHRKRLDTAGISDSSSDSIALRSSYTHSLSKNVELIAGFKYTSKHYASDIPSDQFYFGRRDRRLSLTTGLNRSLNDNTALIFRLGTRSRRTNLERGDLDYDAWWFNFGIDRVF